MNAFRATLEELSDADLLLHVVDASDPRHDEQIEAVEQILGSLGLSGKPRLLVFNKSDRLERAQAAALAGAHRDAAAVSAANRDGLPELLFRCERLLWAGGRVALGDVATEDPSPPDGPPPGGGIAEPSSDDAGRAVPDRLPRDAPLASRSVVGSAESDPAGPADPAGPRLLPAAVRRVS